jgi:hypothetical protein
VGILAHDADADICIDSILISNVQLSWIGSPDPVKTSLSAERFWDVRAVFEGLAPEGSCSCAARESPQVFWLFTIGVSMLLQQAIHRPKSHYLSWMLFSTSISDSVQLS